MESGKNREIKNNPQHADESAVHNRTGSNEHNDYKISGKNEKDDSKLRDEKESYTDYNGNSEANNPARAE